jgi:RNA-binding protein NOB1
METDKIFHTIVLDAGPIIRGEPGVSTLLQQCEQILSTPAVIAEIRDEVTRSRISTSLLPFLIQRNPNPESVKTITDFARKTGDLVVLSRVDIQLLALSYELECERNGGDWRLRKIPGQKRTNGPPPAKPEVPKESTANEINDEEDVAIEASKLEDSGNVPRAHPEIQEASLNQKPAPNCFPPPTHDIEIRAAPESTSSEPVVKPYIGASLSESNPDSLLDMHGPFSEEKASSGQQAEETIDEHQPQLEQIEAMTEQLDGAHLASPNEEEEASESSDSEGWITPSNLIKQQEKDASSGTASGTEPKNMQVVRLFISQTSAKY